MLVGHDEMLMESTAWHCGIHNDSLSSSDDCRSGRAFSAVALSDSRRLSNFENLVHQMVSYLLIMMVLRVFAEIAGPPGFQ